MPLKVDNHRSASETPLKWLDSFVIFRGLGSILLGKPCIFVISLDPPMINTFQAYTLCPAMLEYLDTQSRQSRLQCSHKQSMVVDEDSDQNLDF